MKYLVPAFIIGAVGGLLDGFTDLHRAWCFLIGVATFFLFVLVKSIFATFKIMRQTKSNKRIWIDQNNNIVKVDDE